MILGNISKIEQYGFLEPIAGKCLEYANEHDLKSMKPGNYEIEGKKFFVNIVEYQTVCVADRFWEAHKQYLDMHLMLDGTERIDLALIDRLKQKDYVPEQDYLPLEGQEDVKVCLKKGDFLICFPEDGHRTGVQAEKSETIKKAIFKIQRK